MLGTEISPNPDGNSLKQSRKRNDSGELDVFQATRYFSGFEESLNVSSTATQKQSFIITEQRQSRVHPETELQEKHSISKQPSSPGRRIALFFNCLFQKVGSKKKPKFLKEEESPGEWRRRRRNSTSQLQSSRNGANDSLKSFCSSSSSGFRTPPPSNINTHVRTYKDFASYLMHKQVISLNGSLKSTISLPSNGFVLDDEQMKKKEFSWLDGKPKLLESLPVEHKVCLRDHRYPTGEKENADDGAESDSSSDLFELPVYDPANKDGIKKGAPISNVPL